jgi:hypothetical protein
MAATYTTDLTPITLAESTTGWAALGGGAAGLGVGVDFAMEGTYCVDKQITASEKGQVYNNGSTITPGVNTHFFVWVFLATPGLANTLANRGLSVVLGTATTAYVQFHVEGSNTYGATGRVGKCYAVRYNNTTSASPPYRTLTGSPGANPQYFGATANITGSVKSSNLGVDAIRHGTGAYITAGDSGDPATFGGFAGQNDNLSNRWGILTAIGGGYELQGRFVVGQNNTQTPTACYFSDSNTVVSLIDTPHSLTDFTQIIVDHASTVFNLTNVTVQALGTNNPGRLVFNNASTASQLIGCTFDGLGTTTLRAAVTAINCIWRDAGQITQNSSVLESCTVSKSPTAGGVAAVVSNNPAKITGCTFESVGMGHAIELTSACAGNSYAFDDNNFEGYAGSDGSTGNEVIYNNSGGAVTLNVTSSGSGFISVRNSAGSSTTVATSAALNIAIVDADGNAINGAELTVVDTDGTELFHEDLVGNTTTYSYSTGENTVFVNVVKVAGTGSPPIYYQPKTVNNVSIPASGSSDLLIQMEEDRIYSNPD